jgi:hypothetical protein
MPQSTLYPSTQTFWLNPGRDATGHMAPRRYECWRFVSLETTKGVSQRSRVAAKDSQSQLRVNGLNRLLGSVGAALRRS